MPICLSLCSMILLFVYLVLTGSAHQHDSDEGPAARLYQLLMLSQIPLMMFFLVRNHNNKLQHLLKASACQIALFVLSILAVLVAEGQS